MSRIGKRQIEIPQKTEITVSDNFLIVKGPLGELRKELRPEVSIKIEDGKAFVLPKEESTVFGRAIWGTYASHLSNMIDGVNKPYEKKLILEGVGYKSEVSGDKLILNLGFSHPVKVEIPKDLKVTAEKNNIVVSGIDKERVGQFAAALRTRKKPEPYKGKGMRYDGEIIRRKQGKKTA